MKAHKSIRRQRGFNLLEVLIALVILSVGLLALASLQIALVKSSAEAKTQSIGMAIAKDKIESMRAFDTAGGYQGLTDEAPVTLNDNNGSQGGVNFTRTTTVTRYVYNGTTNQFEARPTDTEDDATLAAVAGKTFKTSKDFKRISVKVDWTDAAGGPQSVAMEDAVSNIDPGDTLDLLASATNAAPRQAVVLRENPGDVAGVIPIAIGNGTSTAATNPTPVIMGSNNSGTKAVATHFEVLTYAGLNGNADDELVKTQSRVENDIAVCQCDYSTAPAAGLNKKGYRPTYWNGNRFTAPARVTSYNVPAGEKALGNQDIGQEYTCGVCCRDHHDPVGVTGPKFAPRRTAHTHYAMSNNVLGAATTTGPYQEVCRIIRVDGIWRVAADTYNDRTNLVQTASSGASPYPGEGSGEGEENYSAFVLAYMDARVVNNNTASTFNTKLRVRSGADSAAQAVIDGQITAIEDAHNLNNPTLLEIRRSDDFKWLHSRALYVDYMEQDARDAVVAAKAACKGTDGQAPDTDAEREACVLPVVFFTSINTSELARWSTSDTNMLTVTNQQFSTVVDATGTTDPVKGKVLPSANAVANDQPHPYSTSTVLDSNAGLAAQDVAFDTDEINSSDKQTFDITPAAAGGNNNGTTYAEITGAAGVLPNYASTQAPQAFFKFSYNPANGTAGCSPPASNVAGYPNPYTCNNSNVGGMGTGVIQNYNYPPGALLSFNGTVTCTKSNGSGAISISMTRNDRPWCRNLDVTAALWRGAPYAFVANGTGKTELNDGRASEVSTFDFSNVQNGDKIVYTFTDETANPYPSVSNTDYTCTYNGNAGSQNQNTVTFQWATGCKP